MNISATFMAIAMTAVVQLQVCSAREIAEEILVVRARTALEAALRERHADIERFDLILLEPSAAKRDPAAPVEIVVPNVASLGKRACVLVRYRNADGSARQSALWWSISAFRPVAVTRRPIRAREVLRESDLTTQSRDVAGMSEPVGDFREIGPDRRARRFMLAGTALQQSDLDYAPEVAREQQVKVKVGAGQVLLETLGVASEEGRTGDIILVTNPASKLRYPARIIGSGEVMVGSAPR